MRAMFITYLVLVTAGLAYFVTIGLLHHGDPISLGRYLTTSEFAADVAENCAVRVPAVHALRLRHGLVAAARLARVQAARQGRPGVRRGPEGRPPRRRGLAALGTSDFWDRTLQNWQSEFLAVGSMAILSVYLRQRGSPESKPVGASHEATGVEG